jgi:hypothetical protein
VKNKYNKMTNTNRSCVGKNYDRDNHILNANVLNEYDVGI